MEEQALQVLQLQHFEWEVGEVATGKAHVDHVARPIVPSRDVGNPDSLSKRDDNSLIAPFGYHLISSRLSRCYRYALISVAYADSHRKREREGLYILPGDFG